VHAYCLMASHFHLVLETPRANLTRGRQWFVGTCINGLNRQRLAPFQPARLSDRYSTGTCPCRPNTAPHNKTCARELAASRYSPCPLACPNKLNRLKVATTTKRRGRDQRSECA
jgi:hypothetical protein